MEEAVRLIKTDKLAQLLGYKSASPAFRSWCELLEIKPVPGRRDVYDPAHVRMRLDIAQGLVIADPNLPEPPLAYDEPSPMELRRVRKASQKTD
jgi:hypothetical protein